MQPLKKLLLWLDQHATPRYYLFDLKDFGIILPDLSSGALRALTRRAVQSGHLVRACKGLYLYPKALKRSGLELFHIASHLRQLHFNYISLETALSDAGVISQIPLSTITIMTSGRSGIIDCNNFGRIEFVHTAKKPLEIIKHVTYDEDCRLWRAHVSLAIKDMKATRRNLDLIDWETADEFAQ